MTPCALTDQRGTMAKPPRARTLDGFYPHFRSNRKGDGVKPTRHLFSSHHLGVI